MINKLKNILYKPYNICCLSVVIIFFALSVYISSKRSLQLDEIIMLITMKRSFINGIFQTQDYSAPLYQLILRILIGNDTPSELLLRFPAIVAGALCLLISWAVFLKNTDRFTALIFLLLLGVNPFFISMVTEARPYAFYALFFISSLFFASELSKSYSKFNALLFASSALLLTYSTYIGILIYFLFSSAMVFLSVRNEGLKRLLKLNLLCILCMLPAIYLAARYVFEGAPALSGDWITKPSWMDFVIAKKFEVFFGDQYSWVAFFLSFTICITMYIYFVYNYLKLNTLAVCQKYQIFQMFKSSPLFWLFVFASILFIYFGFNTISLVFPVYTPRYGFPVVILLCMCFSLFLFMFPIVTRIVLVLIVIILSVNNVRYDINKDFKYIVNAGDRLKQLKLAGIETYLIDWEHGSDWISPELTGLNYYGFNTNGVKFLKLDYGKEHITVNDVDHIADGRHGAILVFNNMQKVINQFLDLQNTPYKHENYGPYGIFIF